LAVLEAVCHQADNTSKTPGDRQKMQRSKKLLRSNPLPAVQRLEGTSTSQGDGSRMAMKGIVVRYRTKPEAAEANAELIGQVFAELKEKAPPGVHYLALRVDDDTFIHISLLEAQHTTSPIPHLEAFRAFQNGIKERCLEPPQSRPATVIGAYRALGET